MIYKLSDDCHEIGYFKSMKDLVKHMLKDVEYFAEWYENPDKEDLEKTLNAYLEGQFPDDDDTFIYCLCDDSCIYIEKIELIGE